MTFTVTASIAVALLAPKHTNIFSHTFRVFALSGWSLEMVLNVTVTTGIVYRIWRIGKQTAALTTGGSSGFKYKSTIITIVESGALITTCTCVIFFLWVAGNVSGLVAIDIAMQVAVSLPFSSVHKHDDWWMFGHRQWPLSSLSSAPVLNALIPVFKLDHPGDTHHPTLGLWNSTSLQSAIYRWISLNVALKERIRWPRDVGLWGCSWCGRYGVAGWVSFAQMTSIGMNVNVSQTIFESHRISILDTKLEVCSDWWVTATLRSPCLDWRYLEYDLLLRHGFALFR